MTELVAKTDDRSSVPRTTQYKATGSHRLSPDFTHPNKSSTASSIKVVQHDKHKCYYINIP